MDERNLCVVGLGYVGLPTATILATRGYHVLGVDIRQDVVDTINRGQLHFTEPFLDALLRSMVHTGQLRAALVPEPCDIYLVAVPTPVRNGSEPDVSYVEAATRSIAPVLAEGNLVILESTSPPGTTEQMVALLRNLRPDLVREDGSNRFFMAYCPERALPGRILDEIVNLDRVVGGVDPVSTDKALAFYETFLAGKVLPTTCRTAEMVKLAENTFRDVNIAYANELSLVCDGLGVDVWEVIRLANRHPRVEILRPGPGVGGHCIAVDPWFIAAVAPKQTPLIQSARKVNNGKEDWVVRRVLDKAGRFRQPVVACLGLAYKPDIDDLRESPALHIVRRLRKESDLTLLTVEPNLKSFVESPLTRLDEALERADIVVFLVAHKEFRRIDPKRLEDRIIIDTCGVFR